MFFVYVLISEVNKRFYIGFTENVGLRLKAHDAGKVESTMYRKPFRLIYYEAYLDRRDALRRERFLKSGIGHIFLRKQSSCFFDNSRGGAVR